MNILDTVCEDKTLFDTAITHPSYTKEKDLSPLYSYERLEFFGDSVLKLYSSELLFKKFPEYDEGRLSKIRSILVSDATIAKIAFEIGLNKIIKLAESEEKQGGRNRESNVACAFEAILGAYYLDGKNKEVKAFLEEQLSKYIEDIDNHFERFNAKAVLQEYTQSQTKELPEYETISVTGPAHKPIFEVRVKYCGKILATAEGKSKKEAEQNCAYQACKTLGIIEDKNE